MTEGTRMLTGDTVTPCLHPLPDFGPLQIIGGGVQPQQPFFWGGAMTPAGGGTPTLRL